MTADMDTGLKGHSTTNYVHNKMTFVNCTVQVSLVDYKSLPLTRISD